MQWSFANTGNSVTAVCQDVGHGSDGGGDVSLGHSLDPWSW